MEVVYAGVMMDDFIVRNNQTAAKKVKDDCLEANILLAKNKFASKERKKKGKASRFLLLEADWMTRSLPHQMNMVIRY
jgi:hypothetical protein